MTDISAEIKEFGAPSLSVTRRQEAQAEVDSSYCYKK